MDYSEEEIEQIINGIDDYLNLRDDWLGSGSVKGPVSESEAEEAVFEITQKLGFLRESLIRFLAAEGALSREEALGSVEESFEEVKSLAKEKLIARDFNKLKKNVLDDVERNILPNEQAQGEDASASSSGKRSVVFFFDKPTDLDPSGRALDYWDESVRLFIESVSADEGYDSSASENFRWSPDRDALAVRVTTSLNDKELDEAKKSARIKGSWKEPHWMDAARLKSMMVDFSMLLDGEKPSEGLKAYREWIAESVGAETPTFGKKLPVEEKAPARDAAAEPRPELLTLDDMKLFKEWDKSSHEDLSQIQRAMLLSTFENSKGEEVSLAEAQKILGHRDALLDGFLRSAFHRDAKRGEVYFNSRRLFSDDKKDFKAQAEAWEVAERNVSELEKEWRKSLRNEAGFSEGVAEREYAVRDIEGEKKVWKMWGDSELSNYLYKSFGPDGTLQTHIVKYFNDWLKEHKNDYVRLYHGTSSSNRASVLKKGILRTTERRRKSYQSSSGFAYLSRWPTMAKTFGDMNNYSDTDVWAVDVKIGDLKPDLDQLANKRQAGTLCGDSLAESLLLGNGARVAKTIQPWQIHRIEFEGEKKTVEAKREAPPVPKESREESSFWQEETTCENFQKRLAMRSEENAVSVAQMLLLGMSPSEQKKFNAIVRSQGFKGPEDLAAWFEGVRSGERKFERKPAAKAKKRSGPEAAAGR